MWFKIIFGIAFGMASIAIGAAWLANERGVDWFGWAEVGFGVVSRAGDS